MTSSSCIGSKKSRSEVSKSVETVSGLLLTIWTSIPSSRRAVTAWTVQ